MHVIMYVLSSDRKANEARRAFLKYIFHEVRSPLNSLSIGIEILSKSAQLTGEEDIESLNMMKVRFAHDVLCVYMCLYVFYVRLGIHVCIAL